MQPGQAATAKNKPRGAGRTCVALQGGLLAAGLTGGGEFPGAGMGATDGKIGGRGAGLGAWVGAAPLLHLREGEAPFRGARGEEDTWSGGRGWRGRGAPPRLHVAMTAQGKHVA